jgi:phytoene dehydrogenase-like protein
MCFMRSSSPQKIAVIGAGIAGSACAHALMLAGHEVDVLDKSRGPGGRLATRRVEWVDRQGQACTTRLDHGAVGLTARSDALRSFLEAALDAGWLAEWAPRQAAGSLPSEDGDRLNRPLPRRVFLVTLAASGAALATRVQAQALVDEKDAQAMALGYVAEAGRVDVKKYPNFVAGQNCTNCALYQGNATDKAAGCSLFAGKLVAGPGWCVAWVKKA